VGVVGDAAIASYKKPHVPVAFRPRMQELAVSRAPVMLFRTSGNPAGVDKAMAAVIAGLGHEYPRRVYALDEHVSLSLLAERLLAGLSVFFGGLAVLLAFVGLYGVLAYAVARRTREIGVRAALGAPRAALLRMVLWEGLVLTLLGVAVGVPCSLAASRLLRSSLFGLEATSLPALVSAAVFVVFVGATAALVPAIRASRVDPITALRVE
jgi:ABC-type antimicrobial peptide transport system permease subunit